MKPKTLNQVKETLINVVEKSKNFYNKASMNSFINKIVKARSFAKVDDFKAILENINKSDQKFKSKNFNQFKQALPQVKLEKQKIIKITYENRMENYIKPIVQKLVKNSRKNKFSKISIKFPNEADLNSERLPSSLRTKKLNEMNAQLFWFFHLDSDKLKTNEYFENPANEKNIVTVKIQTFNRVNNLSDAEHYRQIQSFATPQTEIKCVPKAIIKHFTNKLNNVCKDKRSKYNKIINLMKTEEYNKRYTLEDLKQLSKNLKITFVIRDLINQDITIKPEDPKYNIVLFNTQQDHVELFPTNEQTIDLNQANQIINNTNFYYKLGNQIITTDTIYTIDDHGFGKIINDFKGKHKLNINYLRSDSKEIEYINNYYFGMHQFFNVPEYNKKQKNEIKESDKKKLDNLQEQYEKLGDDIDKICEQNPPIYDVIYTDDDQQIITEKYYPQEAMDKHNEQQQMIKKINKLENKINNQILISDDDYKEYDLKNAYYNLTNNSDYGVPSNAFLYYDDEYSQNIEQHIKENKTGYYHIELKQTIDKIFPTKEHVMTTPQLMTLKKHKIEFNIKSCLISPKIKLIFTEDTLKQVPKIKAYCKIAGSLMKSDNTREIEIHTKDAPNYLKLLKLDKNDQISLSNEYINIFQNKNKTLKHIGFFIHSFVSSEVLDFILSNDISQIIGVKLDSIVVKKDYQAIHNNNFKIKNANIESICKQESFFLKPLFESKNISYNLSTIRLNNTSIYSNFILLSGKGGSGKTESIAKNISLSEIVYASLAWERGVDFKNKYGNVTISSIPKLISYGNKAENELKIPSTTKYIILDEPTLISENEIITIKNKFSDKIILLVGDIDEDGFFYQCSLQGVKDNFKVINPRDHPTMQIIKYTTNYRFDLELNYKLDKLREQMRIIKSTLPVNQQNNKLQEYVLKEFKHNIIDKSKVQINTDDLGISGNQETKKQSIYTNYFIKNGSSKKYYTINTNINNNEYRGETSTQKISNNQELRLFSTIHSTQGKTCEGQLIVIIENVFDFNLYYTAFSRARRVTQIKLINKWE